MGISGLYAFEVKLAQPAASCATNQFAPVRTVTTHTCGCMLDYKT